MNPELVAALGDAIEGEYGHAWHDSTSRILSDFLSDPRTADALTLDVASILVIVANASEVVGGGALVVDGNLLRARLAAALLAALEQSE